MSRILVIDDDPDMTSMVAQTLGAKGHEVVVAADGRQGLTKYLSKPVDLVITDMYMPDQDGVETIRDLRRRDPGLAIIAMSGRAMGETMLLAARRLGALETLQKPFVPAELVAAVERALQRVAN